MSSYTPKREYHVKQNPIDIEDFHEYPEDFVFRPPYQRKSVWSTKKQKALLDSLFRGFYIPRLVLRRVRVGEEETRKEVIDGQQRIDTVRGFLDNELRLPDSLSDIKEDIVGKYYEELPSEVRKFVDKELSFDVDLVLGIDDPEDPTHQQIAAEIFWRLQQGETLNYMEIAHSRLSSLARNFVVKYSDDISFDFSDYRPKPNNSNKHKFFKIIARKNNRMQHLALLTRFLTIEENDGPEDIRDVHVRSYIDKYQTEDGIGNIEFEQSDCAKNVLRVLDEIVEIFKDDVMSKSNSEIKELKTEYFIISVFLLVRHLSKHYAISDDVREGIRRFVVDFHDRWKRKDEDDHDVIVFSDNRQQSAGEIETRQRIFRQNFFEYLDQHGIKIKALDSQRSFSEADRIRIYREHNGLCQQCLNEGKPEEEARVPWDEYEADHVVPHSKGGRTSTENAQLLCSYHNRRKADR